MLLVDTGLCGLYETKDVALALKVKTCIGYGAPKKIGDSKGAASPGAGRVVFCHLCIKQTTDSRIALPLTYAYVVLMISTAGTNSSYLPSFILPRKRRMDTVRPRQYHISDCITSVTIVNWLQLPKMSEIRELALAMTFHGNVLWTLGSCL